MNGPHWRVPPAGGPSDAAARRRHPPSMLFLLEKIKIFLEERNNTALQK
jgi:hypothetical protein